MGLDIDRCAEPTGVDDRYLCGICCGLIVGPKVIAACNHVFCGQCIADWIESKHYCPVERQALDGAVGLVGVDCLADPCDDYYDMYSVIRVKCSHWQRGCRHVSTIVDVETHEMSCAFDDNDKSGQTCRNGHLFDRPETDQNHNCVDEGLKNQIQELSISQTKQNLTNNNMNENHKSGAKELQQLAKSVDIRTAPDVDTVGPSLELQDLVEVLKEMDIISTDAVERTLLAVDRTLFCPHRPYTGYNADIGFGAEFNSPIVDGSVLELIYERLADREEEEVTLPEAQTPVRVLDIGCGTGYLTLCIATLCADMSIPCSVIGIDHIPELIASARTVIDENYGELLDVNCMQFITADASTGYKKAEPYDVVVVEAGVADEYLDQLVEQVSDGGCIIAPVGTTDGSDCGQDLVTIDVLEDRQTVAECCIKVWVNPLVSRDVQLNVDNLIDL